MIQIETTSHDPFFNQAFEDYVFRTFREDEVLLIWRNRPADVVGCYQNICREVHVRALLEQNIPVVRRMAGGGTVYHDLGNLNYTLITGQSGALDYDRCLAPVLRALNALGVPAQKSRTCDMTVDGKKISGSAQKIANGRVLHHGTLLFDADLTRLDEITTGRKNDAFCSKGTQSAICAVTNLRPYLREDCEIVTFARQLAQKILPPGAKPVRLTQAQLADVRYEARHGLSRNAAAQSDASDAARASALLEGARLDPALFLDVCRALAGERAAELFDIFM